LRQAVSGRDVIWVHAVSVGEVLAAAQLIRELKAALPEWVIAVSTTTETGQRLAKQRLTDSEVFYLPLDFAFAVRRYLDVLRPGMVILMESELWPRLIVECAGRGIPVAVVNARISDRSFPRYMRLRRLWRPLLERISLFLAQSEETAERLVRIGAPSERVRVTGNLKYDVQTRDASAVTKRVGSLLGGATLVVAGSTLADEEEMLLAAWASLRKEVPDAVLLIAPRHPDRFDEVSGLIRKMGYPFFRCSELTADNGPIVDIVGSLGGAVLVLDTIGDLASMYALGAVAFVGGSLVQKGGHNPLEPAQFAVPVVMGPWFENFRDVVERMRAEDAIRIVSREGLEAMLAELLRNSAEARAIGDRGRSVFVEQSGATVRSVEALVALLEKRLVSRR
jgi:3-deoxy-D-manno-octulosonic-acid transferase